MCGPVLNRVFECSDAGLRITECIDPFGDCSGFVIDHGFGKAGNCGVASGAIVLLAEPFRGSDRIALTPFLNYDACALDLI